ncbi:flavin reductase family protein [Rhodobacteraceae bacterium N5(2021)]|uniref:Flavin reductase family protein n=1 Tax=Gymnodinialimonas phycosphaerae TaxID=2841589 RepID=A0A975YHL5_9RHOB|nr:flavin reductase family protein [Gymnodinialimonas phycosphaerae]MBY4892799.1 flavin reductase family protein [Gymnodinialimonas phycosphaerae]
MNAATPITDQIINATDLRRTLGCFPTGVAVVTTTSRSGAPIGVTISSFNSVSMDPPLILWSLGLKALSLADFRANGHFAVNVLSEAQAELPRIFSSPVEERFDGLEWTKGTGGVPVLAGSAAVFECSTHARYDGGDHEIFIGRVERHGHGDAAPLLFAKGRLTTLPEAATA